MIQPATLEEPSIALPSDQDASGRSLGAEEVRTGQGDRERTSDLHQGNGVCHPGTALFRVARSEVCCRLLVRHGGRALRDRGHRPGAGRRDHHDADHRHGRDGANPLPGGDPGLRRRRPADRQRHRRYHRRAPQRQDQGHHRHPSVRQPVRDGPDHRTSPGAHGIPVHRGLRASLPRRDGGKLVGTHGAIGCFSLQQGKHITTGEGGLVRHQRRRSCPTACALFVNKAWGYGDPEPDHYFLALNYRLTELQGAVALAQLDKLVRGVRTAADDGRADSREQIEGLAGVATPRSAPMRCTSIGATACG